MVVGVLHLELDLSGATSLKDKRQVVRGLIDRIHRRFNVAVAEVADQDAHDRAVLAVACVSNERRHADQVLAHVAGWVDRQGHMALIGYEVEMI